MSDTAKKLESIMEDIEKVDKKIEKKHIDNDCDLAFYKNLHGSAQKYYVAILEKLKIQ